VFDRTTDQVRRIDADVPAIMLNVPVIVAVRL